jgi:type I restriction enzyme, R subunit
MTREARVAAARATIFALLNEKQKEFIEFVLIKYIETGVEELEQEKLPILLTNKYQSFEDASSLLGDLSGVRELFIEFQKYLYEERVA